MNMIRFEDTETRLNTATIEVLDLIDDILTTDEERESDRQYNEAYGLTEDYDPFADTDPEDWANILPDND